MYENKGKATGWVMPLAHHANIHASFTLLIVGVYTNGIMIPLAAMLFDFVTHFITDRWKAIKKDGPDTSAFWYALGIDQMAHHLVGIIIIYGITIA